MQKIEVPMEATALSLGVPSRATEMNKVASKGGNIRLGSKLAGGESRDLNVANLLAGASEFYLISPEIS